MRFTSDSAVAILCRTSNVDPAGVKPGTFGAQQKPTPVLSFLMSADAGAVVTGIRQNATFRTNIGFAAGADGAMYSLTLKHPSGATVATASGSLGAFGWTQPNVADLFPRTTIPEDATLLVRVTSGSVDVFDSSIDNASGDPVVTPIMPLPADIPSAATIGPEGGSVRSDDGRLTVKVPAGALSSSASVGLQTAPNTAPNGVGSGYSLTVGGASFAKAPLASLRYSARDLVGSGPEHLMLAYQSAGTLYALRGSTRDTSTRTLWTPLLGAPFGAKSTLSKGSRETLTKDSGAAIAPILDFTITPGKAGVLSGRSVQFKLTGTHVLSDGTLAPVDLTTGTTWELQPSGAPGNLLALGDTATYVAPQAVSCVQPLKVVFHRNIDRMNYVGWAEITLLPRVWELLASAVVRADHCKVAGNSPSFTLMTDLMRMEMTLIETADGFQFTEGIQASIVSKGSYASDFLCPSKGCANFWKAEPKTDLNFYGGVLADGGWDNTAGTFLMRNFGLVLGGGIQYEWGYCQGGFGRGMLPGMGGLENLGVSFSPPDPNGDCKTEMKLTWQDYRDLLGVPVTKKDVYYGTEYHLALEPK